MYRGLRGAQPILYAVMHVNVGPEVEGGARGLANYLENNGPTGGGYQTISDDKELIRMARDDEIVYGAGGVNHNAVHHCFVGQADQTTAQWLDAYSRSSLNFGAKQTREWCNKYGLPMAWIGGKQIAARNKGICGHVDVNQSGLPGTVWPGGHYDPGPNFPWALYLSTINGTQPTHPPAPGEADPEEDSMVVLPQAPTKGRRPTARVVKAYNCVLLEDGGRVKGDHQVGNDPTTHTWIPAGLPPGSTIVGVDKLEGQKLLVVRYNFTNGDSGTYEAQLP